VLRGEMAVAGGHRDRLVPGQLLDLLDGCPGHCQPTAEGMAIRVPYVLLDPGILQAGDKPGASVEPVLFSFTGEHGVRGLLPWATHRLDRLDRLRVEVEGATLYDPPVALRAGCAGDPPVDVHHPPGENVLLTQAGPGMDGKNELGQVLWKASLDHRVKPGVFLAAEVADPTGALLPVAHQVSRVHGYFPVAEAFTVAEGNERLVAVGGGGYPRA
jgi:hypothetical protein